MLSACTPTIAAYNVETYRAATTLKLETDTVLQKASEPFAAHESEVTALESKLKAATDLAAAIPSNGNAAAQWRIMSDPAGHMAGGTLARWRRDGTLGAGFLTEQRPQIAEGFDYIICLELNKLAERKCAAGGVAPGGE
ncbi:MAG: hypothetical protein ABW023_06140 [Sphingomonas sp.]